MEKCDKCKIKCDFSFRHYREILNLFKEHNYKFLFFSETDNSNKKKVYLRHDIDFSLEKALVLARIEYKENTKSSYFIRLRAPFYNIFDNNCQKIIKEILNLGHEIGIHYEGNIYGYKTLIADLTEKDIYADFSIMKKVFNIKKIVSFHQPCILVLNQRLKRFINTYDAGYFKDTKYLSDSRGFWREGCVCGWLHSKESQNFQILIHPIWWTEKSRKKTNHYLHGLLKEKFIYLDDSLTQQIQTYTKKYFKP